jgi:hypothetical protein
MTRAVRSLVVAATLGVMLFTGALAAHAASVASGAAPGAGCSNTSSAIDQYCEDIPSASGSGTPPPGTPGPSARQLGSALPRSAARTFRRLPAATRTRARGLLSLPASAAAVPVSGSIAAHRGAWSLPSGVILAMVAIVAACAAAAVFGRRRRGTGGTG